MTTGAIQQTPLQISPPSRTPPDRQQTAAKPYSIVQESNVKKWKTGVEERQYSVKFHQEKAGISLF